MATQRNYPLVAFAVIFSALLIPLTKNTGVLNYIPDIITDRHLSIFTFLSILCGLFLLDKKFSKYGIIFATPILIMALITAFVIYANKYLLVFSNYFTLWLAVVVYMYWRTYKKDLWIKPHQWLGIEILLSSAFIVLGNKQIGAINHIINFISIDHVWWGMFIGIFGIVLIAKGNIRLTKIVLLLSFPLIVQYFYIALYLLFIGSSKSFIPLIILRIIYIGKISEEYYDAF
jgi:hypothetical protein